jgi:hypothetical protein
MGGPLITITTYRGISALGSEHYAADFTPRHNSNADILPAFKLLFGSAALLPKMSCKLGARPLSLHALVCEVVDL